MVVRACFAYTERESKWWCMHGVEKLEGYICSGDGGDFDDHGLQREIHETMLDDEGKVGS